ncbi:MAG TPA: ATP-grasp domain-containing protein [Thermoanaerobaculia bacterium]
MWHRRAAGDGSYLLLLGFDLFLRERSVVAAQRVFPGPVVGMACYGRPWLQRNRFIDHVLPGSPLSEEAVLAAVTDFEATTGLRPRAVVPLLDLTLKPGLRAAERYGLPYLTADCIESSRDKDRMKQIFHRHGLPAARHAVFSGRADLEAAVAQVGLPCVLKPRELGGSLGVVRVDRAEDLAAAFAHCLNALDSHADQLYVGRGRFQAESYIPAEAEVSVEVFNHGARRQVIAVTDKALGPPPFFAEMGHAVPSAYSGNARLRELALAACAALGIDRGIAHVEIRISSPDRMFLIEVGARPAGDALLDQVERAYGFSPYEYHVRSYLDEVGEFPPTPEPAGTSAIAFLKARPGTIQEIHLPAELPPEVVSLYITAKPGSVAGSPSDYDQREGAIELFWPEIATDAPPTRHIEVARQLTERIFTVA